MNAFEAIKNPNFTVCPNNSRLCFGCEVGDFIKGASQKKIIRNRSNTHRTEMIEIARKVE